MYTFIFYKHGIIHILEFSFEQLAFLERFLDHVYIGPLINLLAFQSGIVLLGVNNSKSSIMASQYFLLDKQLSITFM